MHKMEAAHVNYKTSPRKIGPLLLLGGLLVLFVGPIIVAWTLYASKSFVPETLNYGQFIQPPRPLSKLKLYDAKGNPFDQRVFQGEWLLLYMSPGSCQKLCKNNLYKMRQVRKALGKNMERVERAVLTFTPTNSSHLTKLLQGPYKGTLHLTAKRSAVATYLTNLPLKKVTLQQGALYVVDPLGNVMMAYKPTQTPKGILKDLKRLLFASKVG